MLKKDAKQRVGAVASRVQNKIQTGVSLIAHQVQPDRGDRGENYEGEHLIDESAEIWDASSNITFRSGSNATDQKARQTSVGNTPHRTTGAGLRASVAQSMGRAINEASTGRWVTKPMDHETLASGSNSTAGYPEQSRSAVRATAEGVNGDWILHTMVSECVLTCC